MATIKQGEPSPPEAPAPPSSGPSLPPPPPPADAERVTPCGGVLKSVLKKGGAEGAERPPLHSRCLVHYEGRLQSSGETFIKSAEEGRGTGEPAVVVAGRDASLRATGLNMAVMAMARGEKARVWIEDPKKFGYGERGSFSFPAVPPLAKLIYDVELVAFEPPDDDDDDSDPSSDSEEEGGEVGGVGGGGDGGGETKAKKKKEKKERRPPRSAGSLTYEGRLEAAARRKLRGNALLTGGAAAADGTADGTGSEGQRKEGDPAAALQQYLLALSYLDDDFLFQLEGPHLEAASALARAARLNCAAARLALGDARGAAADAGEVLRERPRDAKALFRRGRARRALGDARGAVEDLRRAAREPEGRGDRGILRELAAAEAEVGEAARAGDEVMGRALARSVGKGGLFSEEEQEGGRKRKGEGKGGADPPSPPPPPVASPQTMKEGEAAPGSQQATGGALFPAPLLVVAVAAVALAAAAVARWVGEMMKREGEEKM